MTGDNFSIPLVTEPTKDRLTDRQLVDFRSEQESFCEWLQHFGKDPHKAVGYGNYTVQDTMYRTDRFFRWLWTEEGEYTTRVTLDHADQYMKFQARREVVADTQATVQRAIKRFYKWLHFERDYDEWEPEIKFSNSALSKPQDFLTRDERGAIREAAMEYGKIPGYNDLDPDERDHWRRHLAKRYEIPMTDVTPAHWDRANGWKMPSLVWASLDAGLRPVEVNRFTTSWLNLENDRLLIPKEDSSKNVENWIVPLRERTATALKRWVQERQLYDKYAEDDHVWLTREGNPYSASSLRYLMGQLFDIAGIPRENRTVSWYTIRHSTATYMTREEDLKAAKSQLRHKDPKTTMRYDQAPEGDRRKALDRMG